MSQARLRSDDKFRGGYHPGVPMTWMGGAKSTIPSGSRHPTRSGMSLVTTFPFCHPERSRGTCGAPFPLTNFQVGAS
jgi:hypothetical protein